MDWRYSTPTCAVATNPAFSLAEDLPHRSAFKRVLEFAQSSPGFGDRTLATRSVSSRSTFGWKLGGRLARMWVSVRTCFGSSLFHGTDRTGTHQNRRLRISTRVCKSWSSGHAVRVQRTERERCNFLGKYSFTEHQHHYAYINSLRKCKNMLCKFRVDCPQNAGEVLKR